MRRPLFVVLALLLCLAVATGCSLPKKMEEVKPSGMTMLVNQVLDTVGSDAYTGYVGVKIKVLETDLQVTMLGRIGLHMRNDHLLTILDETKAVVATATLTASPDAYYKDIAYVALPKEQEVVLKAGTAYYILSKEEAGKDFWYGEKTSTSANPYFTMEGVVMSEDAYDFAIMKDTQNKVLGPVDFVFTALEKEG